MTPRRDPLPYIGYKPLKPGRIHFYCGCCGRKMSNMPRKEYDPPKAALAIFACDRCADLHGAKDQAERYRDAGGNVIPFDPDEEIQP